MQRTTALLAPAAAILCLAAMLTAGPLSPPSGPVASTYKTLTEVEPRIAVGPTTTPGDAFNLYRIAQPGSYYLTGNVSIPSNVLWGISIEAPGVTLDLNGFTLNGNGNHVGGIACSAAGVTIRNGTIRRVYASGISFDLFPTGSPGQTIENMRVIDVSGPGFPPGGSPGAGVAGIFAGRGAIIRNCYVNNAPLGIAAGYNSNISGCTVEFARQVGFHLQGGASISNCVVVGTSGGPTDGHAYFLGAGSAASNCVARSNEGTGFVADEECTLTNCTATNNVNGFSIAARGKVHECTAASNTGTGVLVASGNQWSVTDCALTSNSAAGVAVAVGVSHGQVSGNFIRGLSLANSVGIRIPGSTADIAVFGNTIGLVLRGVELDGSFSRVTNNSFNQVNSGAIQTSSSGVPNSSNILGPIVTSGGVGTATNPFSNFFQ